MSNSKSKAKFWIIFLTACLPIVFTSTWLARGFYDQLFMFEGRTHVVNTTAKDHKVELTTPAGHTTSLELPASASKTIDLKNTGEGSIKITIDGKRIEEVGYVTTMNGIMVLTISEKQVLMTQLLN